MENLQYQRTDRAIIHAFIVLCNRNSFYDVTVQDIIDEALVSRYTFYAHFKDKYEIAEILEKKLADAMDHFLDVISVLSKKNKYGLSSDNDIGKTLLSFKSDYLQIFNAIRNIKTDSIDIEKKFKDIFKKHYRSEGNGDDELQARIYSAILYEISIYLLEHNEIKETEYSEIGYTAYEKVFRFLQKNSK